MATIITLDIKDLANLFGKTRFDDFFDVIKTLEKTNEAEGVEWGLIHFDPRESCRGNIVREVMCHDINCFHTRHGPLGYELGELFYDALYDFANTPEGRKACKVQIHELNKIKFMTVRCRYNKINMVELFNKFVKPRLKPNDIVIIARDRDETYIILTRRKE